MKLIEQLQAERDRLTDIVQHIDGAIAALQGVAPPQHVPPPRQPAVRVLRSAKPPKAVKKKPKAKAAPAKSGKPAPSAGEITTGEAAKRYDFSPKTLSMLKKSKRITGRYGHIDVASIEDYVATRVNAAGQRSTRGKRSTGKKAERPAAEKPWDPADVMGQTYKPLTWIAKQLEMDVDQVEEIVHNGGIHGSDSHANWEQIQAYMKHKDYKAPVPAEA